LVYGYADYWRQFTERSRGDASQEQHAPGMTCLGETIRSRAAAPIPGIRQ
jgi:hypothetical protein